MDGLPLAGLRVLVTRERAQSEELAARLSDLGADPVVCPCIEIVELCPPGLDEALAGLDRFDWLVCTSANAVAPVVERVRGLGFRPDDHLSQVGIAAVGRRTASALEASGLSVDLMPETESAAGLADALIAARIEGKRVLLPGSKIARPDLPEALRAGGAAVCRFAVYDTVRPARMPAQARIRIERGEVDILTFASPSAVHNFVELAGGELLRSRPVVCIGETTARAAREAGVPEPIIARQPSADGLIAALLEFRTGMRQEASTDG